MTGVFCARSLQMNDSGFHNTVIRHFVRESLGCNCPDEVFENISVSTHSELFSINNTVYDIGGRLFVAVVAPDDWHDVRQDLAQMIDTGKSYRDRHGFNRFRLVVVTDNNDAKKKLPSLFGALPNIDDKTHLHVIGPELLPRNASA